MREALLATLSALFLSLVPFAHAADAPDVKGLYLLTDYPAVTVRPGNTSTISAPPAELCSAARNGSHLSVDGVPQGWTATLLGGGQPVAAAMPATNCQCRAAASRRRAGQGRDRHATR